MPSKSSPLSFSLCCPYALTLIITTAWLRKRSGDCLADSGIWLNRFSSGFFERSSIWQKGIQGSHNSIRPFSQMRVLYHCQSCDRGEALGKMYYCPGCQSLLCDLPSCSVRELEYYYCPACFDSMTSSELAKNHYKSGFLCIHNN